MNEVKRFQFPTFEEWQQHEFKWSGQIGDFYCEIQPAAWAIDGSYKEFGCAIAADPIPLNLYVNPVVRRYFKWDYKNMADLKAWYEEVTNAANDKWVLYIQEKYLD